MVNSLLFAALLAQAALISASPTQILGRDLGGKCTGPHGQGTWQREADCRGVCVPEKTCPADESGVQCCVEIKCQADGGEGMCRSVKHNGCSKGEFHPGACPGGDDVQCCIKDCEDEPPTPEPEQSTSCTEEQQSSSAYPTSAAPSSAYPTSAYPTSAYPSSAAPSDTASYPTKSKGHHSHTKPEHSTYSHSKPAHSSSYPHSKPEHSKTDKPTHSTGKPKETTTKPKESTTKPKETTTKPKASTHSTAKPEPTTTSKPKPKPKPSSSSVGKKILAQAMKAKGTPYAWGGGSCKGPSGDQPPYDYGDVGFDCSGLVCWALCQVTGRDLFKAGLRNTHNMYCASEHKLGYKKYKYADRQAGDAVFFGDACSCDNSKSIHHVGLIMDDKDKMFNSPNDQINKAQVNSIPHFGEKPCPYVIRFTDKPSH